MEKVIIASNNMNKIREFSEMLGDGVQVLSLKDVGFSFDIEENGETFLDNALIKAKTISLFLREKGVFAPVFSDDSGLAVNSLGGAPGVHSARYAGMHGDDKKNRDVLLKNLENAHDRSAYFISVIVCYYPDDTYVFAEGKTYGHILCEEEGTNGFGYDCIFYSSDLQKSFGLATAEEKNAVSHRARALQEMLRKIK